LRKLALKKLKKSDLTFFKSYFKNHDTAKQKGFNLDTKLIEGKFFPGLKDLLQPLPKKSAHVDLIFMGPGLARPYSLARKIKIDAKNIRLNGELVHDPEDQPGRFDALKEDDFVLLEFDGSPLPDTVKAILIAEAVPEDFALHVLFEQFLIGKNDSMCQVTEQALQEIIDHAKPLPNHPVRDWLEPELLEGVAIGDPGAVEEVNKRRPRRGMSAADLKAAKLAAERTGEIGEELLDVFLGSGDDPLVKSHKWISQENAISPYDFLVHDHGEFVRHVDAKSTSSAFSTPLYLSTAEIRHALKSGVPYDIYRLYHVSSTGAKIRIARDIRERLKPVMALLESFPQGVGVDSLSFKPEFFGFEPNEFPVAPIDDEDIPN
jgi:hypothetical protein